VIAIDTSALIAIVLREPLAADCLAAVEAEDDVLISAATLAEALIVSARRSVAAELVRLLDRIDPTVVLVAAATAQRIGAAYERWGRGVHPAALNFGDCFAYDVAREHGCRLLYVGDDFAKTDIESAL